MLWRFIFQSLMFDLVPDSQIIGVSDFESNVCLTTHFFGFIAITNYRYVLL